MVPDVATSISCRDINLSLWRFQLVAFGIATSVSCRDISSCLWRLQLFAFGCRDISPLSRHQLMSLEASTGCFWVSRHQSLVATLYLIKGKPIIASRRFSCRDLHPLARHQPLSRHHDAVATSFIKSLVNPQLPNL